MFRLYDNDFKKQLQNRENTDEKDLSSPPEYDKIL